MVELLYFAWVREMIGTDGETIDLPAEVETVAAPLADRSRIRVAVDQIFAGPDTALAGAREIAIFPPVTGG